MVQRPRLTFACELDPARLSTVFADRTVFDDLRALNARVALMLSDFSAERATVVRHLNEVGIPVVGIPLLPLEEGYYFTADNASRAAARYEEWAAWTQEHGLAWDGVGLDVEPDARIYQQIMEGPWGLVPILLPRVLDRQRPGRARREYMALVDRIRADGWTVENYQFPLIADERWAGSTILQRLALVDVRTDREVWMLYSSFMRGVGPGLIWSYGPEASAIGVGTTGGGPDISGSPQMPTLRWDELARDLLLARHWCDDILIHSLEGCISQGFLPRLQSFDWEAAVAAPNGTRLAGILRSALRGSLWASAHPWPVLGTTAVLASLCLVPRLHEAFDRTFDRRVDRTLRRPAPVTTGMDRLRVDRGR
jgi:hypothetical protein